MIRRTALTHRGLRLHRTLIDAALLRLLIDDLLLLLLLLPSRSSTWLYLLFLYQRMKLSSALEREVLHWYSQEFPRSMELYTTHLWLLALALSVGKILVEILQRLPLCLSSFLSSSGLDLSCFACLCHVLISYDQFLAFEKRFLLWCLGERTMNNDGIHQWGLSRPRDAYLSFHVSFTGFKSQQPRQPHFLPFSRRISRLFVHFHRS